jgi:tetratricopeptide (TPR) repeat protein
VHQDAGDLDAALLHERRALAAAEGVGDKREIARQQRVLADILIAAKRPREAVPCLEKAVAIYHEMKAPVLEARALGALGNVWSDLGEIKRARQAFEPGLETARTSQDQQAEANALNGLGNLALATGDLARACLLHEEALRLFKRVEDADGELSSRSNLGAAYLRLGDWAQARNHIEEALTAAVKAQNTIGAVRNPPGRVLLTAKGAYAEAPTSARSRSPLEGGREHGCPHARTVAALPSGSDGSRGVLFLDSALADLRKGTSRPGLLREPQAGLRLAGVAADALRAIAGRSPAQMHFPCAARAAGIAAALEAGGGKKRASGASALDGPKRRCGRAEGAFLRRASTSTSAPRCLRAGSGRAPRVR